jgi:glycosyltransferase involved in cell wall biosynthesis
MGRENKINKWTLPELKPFFSIIMAARITPYPNQAKNIEAKMHRAIQSVRNQSVENYQLIIIADDCQRAVEVACEAVEACGLEERSDIRHFQSWQKLWSGAPRNVGLFVAQGQWAVYLDIDDAYKEDYLQQLEKEIRETPGYDFYSVDDYQYNVNGDIYKFKHDLNRKGRCGTSNIIHHLPVDVWWENKGKYDHDWKFIQRIKTSGKGTRLDTCGYFVMHIPGRYDR